MHATGCWFPVYGFHVTSGPAQGRTSSPWVTVRRLARPRERLRSRPAETPGAPGPPGGRPARHPPAVCPHSGPSPQRAPASASTSTPGAGRFLVEIRLPARQLACDQPKSRRTDGVVPDRLKTRPSTAVGVDHGVGHAELPVQAEDLTGGANLHGHHSVGVAARPFATQCSHPGTPIPGTGVAPVPRTLWTASAEDKGYVTRNP